MRVYIHIYVYEDSTVLYFHTILQVALNYSCLLAYSFLHPHLPYPSSLDLVCPSHPSITIYCISLSYGDISVPLVPYSIPILCGTMNRSLVIIAL